MMKHLLPILLVALAFTSCKTGYVANSVNAPMLSQKGEFQASALYGTSMLNVQTAYAVTDKLGMMINGNFHYKEYEDNWDPTNILYVESGYFAELGVGYSLVKANNFQFDLYGGLGGGRIKSLETGGSYYDMDGYNGRFFIQPTLGLVHKIVEISFVPRISYVQVHNTNINPDEVLRDIFFEPHAVFKVGFKNVKFLSQMGFIIPTPLIDQSVGANPFSLSIGIQYSLGGGRWDN